MAPKIPTIIPVHNAEDVARHLAEYTPALTLAETEETWEKICGALQRITALCAGGACDYPDALVPSLKALARPLTTSLASERSRLSAATTETVSALASGLGSEFEPLVAVFVPALIQLCARPNKVFVARARAALRAVIAQTQLPALLKPLCAALTDKSAVLRLAAAEGVLECVGCLSPPELEKEARATLVEGAVRATACDATADVRKVARQIFEAYSVLLPARVTAFTSGMDGTMRKYLGVAASSRPASQASTRSRPASAMSHNPPPPRPATSMSTRAPPAPKPALSAARSTSDLTAPAPAPPKEKVPARRPLAADMPPPATIPARRPAAPTASSSTGTTRREAARPPAPPAQPPAHATASARVRPESTAAPVRPALPTASSSSSSIASTREKLMAARAPTSAASTHDRVPSTEQTQDAREKLVAARAPAAAPAASGASTREKLMGARANRAVAPLSADEPKAPKPAPPAPTLAAAAAGPSTRPRSRSRAPPFKPSQAESAPAPPAKSTATAPTASSARAGPSKPEPKAPSPPLVAPATTKPTSTSTSTRAGAPAPKTASAPKPPAPSKSTAAPPKPAEPKKRADPTQPTLSQLARMAASAKPAAAAGTRPLALRRNAPAFAPKKRGAAERERAEREAAAAAAVPLPESPRAAPAEVPLPASPLVLAAGLPAVEAEAEAPATVEEPAPVSDEGAPAPRPHVVFDAATPVRTEARAELDAAKTPISSLVAAIQRGFDATPAGALSPPAHYAAPGGDSPWAGWPKGMGAFAQRLVVPAPAPPAADENAAVALAFGDESADMSMCGESGGWRMNMAGLGVEGYDDEYARGVLRERGIN